MFVLEHIEYLCYVNGIILFSPGIIPEAYRQIECDRSNSFINI